MNFQRKAFEEWCKPDIASEYEPGYWRCWQAAWDAAIEHISSGNVPKMNAKVDRIDVYHKNANGEYNLIHSEFANDVRAAYLHSRVLSHLDGRPDEVIAKEKPPWCYSPSGDRLCGPDCKCLCHPENEMKEDSHV